MERLEEHSRECLPHLRTRTCICRKDVLELSLLSTDLSGMNHTESGNILPDRLSVFNQLK